MGGFGSGRWQAHYKKETVEDSLVISASKMVREGDLQPRQTFTSIWAWSGKHDGQLIASVGFEVDTLVERLPTLRLFYRWGQQRLDYSVRLETTKMRFGGVRWWFHCPCWKGNSLCARRVDKLYRPPSSGYFGCRQCQGLTYRSCQESDKRVSRLRNNPELLEAMLDNNLEKLGPNQLALVLKALSH